MPKVQKPRCKLRWHMLWQRLKEGVHKCRESVSHAYEDNYFVDLFFPVLSEPEEQEDLCATPMEEETEARSVSDQFFGSSSWPLEWINDCHPESPMNQFESHEQTSQIAATASQDMPRQETGSAAQQTPQQDLVTTTENDSLPAPQFNPETVCFALHQDMVSLRLGVFFQVTQAYKCFMRRLRRQRSNDGTVRLLLRPHHLLETSFQITSIILLNFERAINELTFL